MHRPLFTLQLPNSAISSLMKMGFHTCDDLLAVEERDRAKLDELLQTFGYSYAALKGLIEPPTYMSAADSLKFEMLRSSIPTFSESLDLVLGGGVKTDTVLEVCGPPSSGKTQLMLQLCVNVQIPASIGGLEGHAVYIDTDSGFTISRLKEMASAAVAHCQKIIETQKLDITYDLTVESILNRIYYVPVDTHIELLSSVQILLDFIPKNPLVKIVVIDSLIFPLLTPDDSRERTRVVYRVLNQLFDLATTFSLAVVFTNHLTTKISTNAKVLGQALGESLCHRVPHVLLLGKIGENFTALLSKSCELPEITAQFRVTKDGIRDVS